MPYHHGVRLAASPGTANDDHALVPGSLPAPPPALCRDCLMRALTLHQPWASLIAALIKTSETRSWTAPLSLWGQWLAIHAAQRPMQPEQLSKELRKLLLDSRLDGRMPSPLPLGAVVATVRLLDCVQIVAGDATNAWARTPDGETLLIPKDIYGDYSIGRWVWRFDSVEPLVVPVAQRGRQGLWTCDLSKV